MIELALTKQHLRVDHDYDDALIGSYISAAQSAFEVFTNRTLIATGGPLPDPVGNAMYISKSIEQGALLLVGSWYANRETVAVGITASSLPMATSALWMPHRWACI